MHTSTRFDSRAVERPVNPGSDVACAGCGQLVKFAARTPAVQVIANVYVGGIWNRVEHFHRGCYDEAGMPYGEVSSAEPALRPLGGPSAPRPPASPADAASLAP